MRTEAADAPEASVLHAGAGVPVADVAGAFGTAERVCAWTWFCARFDTKSNATGYGMIANEFLEVLNP